MTKRYFKATDGQYTIFRASESRVYRGAWMRIDRIQKKVDGAWVKVGEPLPVAMGFSAKSHPALGGAPFAPGSSGDLPAIEIGKAEYATLVAIKTARIEAWQAELRAKGQTMFGSVSPGDSWVRNEELDVRGFIAGESLL